MYLSLLTLFLPFLQVVLAASRTSPPSGSLVVRAGTTTSGEFKTISAAVAALPSDSSSRSIFVYPGTYTEQVYIDRPGPLTVNLGFILKTVAEISIFRSMDTRKTLVHTPPIRSICSSTHRGVILLQTMQLAP